MDATSDVPPYEQVRAQIARLIESGDLRSETRLPTVRRLAADLDLAPNTVARAYRELELAGLIETRGRNGSVVAGAPSPHRAKAVAAARVYVDRTAALGVEPAEAMAIVRRELESAATTRRSL